VFSSIYSSYRDRVIDVINEFSTRLGCIQGKHMLRHLRDGDLVTVEYEGDITIYINYSEEYMEIDGLSIRPLDYIVVGGKEGEIINETVENFVTAGQSNRIFIRIAVAVGCIAVLLYAAYILRKTGFFRRSRHENP
jgi:hypothetical protein